MKHYLLTPFLLFTIFSFFTHAEPPQPNDPVPFSQQEYQPDYHLLEDPLLHEPDNFQAKFMNMLFLLGLLIGFMLLASWFLKRMTRTRVTQQNDESFIKVLEARTLSPRSTLYLLDVKGHHVLIAESPTSVSHLASLEPNDTADEERGSKETPEIHRALPPYFSGPSNKT